MAHPPAIELAPGVVRIPTIGSASTNSFALVDDDGSVTLVDCGLKRAPAKIVAGLRGAGGASGGGAPPPPYDPTLLVGRLISRVPGGGFPPVAVGERLVDRQLLDVAGGLRVVATPGHTPGHVSLLHEPTGTLITGDALFNVRQLRFSPRPLCTDFRLNEQTAQVLGELEYDRVGFTHGTEILRCAREAVRGFLGEVPRHG